jgi:hypothetical protein
MTRWGTKDLTARLLKSQSNSNADQWEVIEFPAVFDEGEENERALWPSFWELDELRAVRASMSVQKWNAMYQQRPTADEGAILKREWWRIWDKDYMPRMEYIIQSYDTAYSKKETADFLLSRRGPCSSQRRTRGLIFCLLTCVKAGGTSLT